MMAAFIVAIRGSVKQAVLLGLAATLSHTAVVWLVAIGGMYLGKGLDAQTTEPYFQLASSALIIVIALWMLWRTWRGEQMFKFEQGDDHHHDEHDHGHHDETHRIDTSHGRVELSIFEEGMPPHWRLKTLTGHAWAASDVRLMTTRPDGSTQSFSFVEREGFLESAVDIPEPHEFSARLSLGHAGHSHDYDLEYQEHDHGHAHSELEGLELSIDGYQDAHERAHANDIRKRFTNREVTTGQIIMFGLTGGAHSLPCGHHRSTALPSDQRSRLGWRARPVLQHWSGAHTGYRRCSSRYWRQAGLESLALDGRRCASCTLPVQRVDHRCWSVRRLSWLDRPERMRRRPSV